MYKYYNWSGTVGLYEKRTHQRYHDTQNEKFESMYKY